MAGKKAESWSRTANIALKRQVSPVKGVYAVKATVKQQSYYGVANVGNKPTLNGTKALLEVHLFNFSETIGGSICKRSS